MAEKKKCWWGEMLHVPEDSNSYVQMACTFSVSSPMYAAVVNPRAAWTVHITERWVGMHTYSVLSTKRSRCNQLGDDVRI